PRPFGQFVRPAAHQELRAETVEGQLRSGDIFLVAFGIAHIDAGDPISLGHSSLPIYAERISSRIACAAARRSLAATIGRATTRWLAPLRIACAGVTTRFWSPWSLPAGRMP